MAKGILGQKVGITQIFDDKGILIPITIVDVSENVVLQQKTFEKDGYQSTQLGFGSKKEKITTKPLLGHFLRTKTKPKRFIREISFSSDEINELKNLSEGDIVNINLFKAKEIIDVTGISKGKGFSGSIKRHNQSRGPESHGSRYHRRPGSMGPIKGNITGKKLPGQMGHKKITLQNLILYSVDSEKKIFLIKGSIPGPKKSFVIIKSAVKKITRKFIDND
ncbi:MAG: 50S ribosomal protein L3 [Candidatus Phytoplasma stylosanthis]|uniref:50S ribosomal protein L3 n=1 Tax=Candidatus Phytoplasma stylosanthis TaxID=2798314 RepID=UPI00293A3408|nr:50S ribosomal protein L3 [Candidatus Phytoplasma stylosanthis]MDV3167838.1 50S ribosomal protein L3 [Candidatus Phytoplasma stylosanthis]MDV3170886.1 50S ribosomal protein L3 [Candidatus Phytoplasma stylosanthis]MDV3173698.1 50S ribosomal protein L3 [Candidatus Phytoplasma stylosanthis]MDV3174066.1 50S ribosomal protein L3 [Candidatus Phytoplasma stylosanthis]MDV3202422.1 50S ribosomal protein L3 [Candidatus Phytoplasma stylosanthis]